MILCEDKNYISASERCNNTKFSEADEPQRLPYRNCFEILDVVTEDCGLWTANEKILETRWNRNLDESRLNEWSWMKVKDMKKLV